jgi:hypothetical protein
MKRFLLAGLVFLLPAFVYSQEEELDELYPSLTVSGELRVRPEYRNNEDFNEDANDSNSFIASRTRIGLSVKVNDRVGLFIQPQHTATWGSELLTAQGTEKTFPVGGDESGELSYRRNFYNALDLHQAYLTLENLFGISLTVKAGRQEINYGDQRLIGAFGWSNYGRAFDSILFNYKLSILSADLFCAKIVESNDGDNDTDLAGLHITLSPEGMRPEVNAYVFYKRDSAGPSTAQELWTGGARVHFTGIKGLAFTAEGAYQWGLKEERALKIQAFAGAVKAKYSIPVMLKPEVLVEYDIASGDKDGSDKKYETFDNLYPTNHPHYGYMDYMSWKNMQDVRAGLGFRPVEKVAVNADYHVFSLYTNKDNWYRASGAVLITTDGVAPKDIGNEVDVLLKCDVIDNVNFELGYSHFFKGDFIDAIKGGGAADSDWAYLSTRVSF